MIIAEWKMPLYKADAQKVAEEIAAIGETATPAQIVEKARDEASELHKCFDWDDTVAADKWRLQQARQVVTLLVVTIKNDEPEAEPVRLRVFERSGETYDAGYKQTFLIVQDKDEYKALLRRAKSELEAFKRKYKALVELEKVFEAIDEL